MMRATLVLFLTACGGAEDQCGFWFDDRDGDGFGDVATGEYTCSPGGRVDNGRDCDDADAGRIPDGVYEGSVIVDEHGPDVDLDGECIGTVTGSVMVMVDDLSSLHSLVQIAEELRAPMVTSVEGLSGLRMLGSLNLSGPGLTSFRGLERLSYLGEARLAVGIESLEGLPRRGNVGALTLEMPSLRSLEGLPESVDELVLRELPAGCDLSSDLDSVRSLAVEDTALRSLHGLDLYVVDHLVLSDNEALTSVSLTGARLESLSFRVNPALTSVELGEISQIEAVHVFDAMALESLPLDGLTVRTLSANKTGLVSLAGPTVTESLDLSENPALNALPEAAETLEHVSLSNNSELASLAGLEPLREIHELRLVDLPALSSVTALDGLQNAFTIEMVDVPKLNTVGLPGLLSAGSITINRSGVTDLAGFEALDPPSVGLLDLRDNPLTSISGLGAVRAIDVLIISTSEELSMEGMTNLQEVGTLDFDNVDALVDGPPNLALVRTFRMHESSASRLPKLPALKELDELYLETNVGFTSLSGSGLEELTEITGSVGLLCNDDLSNISALQGLKSIGGRLTITGNGSLPQAEIDALLEAIGEENIGSIDIQDDGGC